MLASGLRPTSAARQQHAQAACPPRASSSGSRAGRRPTHVVRAVPDWLRKTLDFKAWAPKSSRIWRLQEFEVPTAEDEAARQTPADMSIDDLQARANQQAKDAGPSTTAPALASRGAEGAAQASRAQEAGLDGPTKSFAEADDGELAQALQARLQSMAGSSSSSSDEEGHWQASGSEASAGGVGDGVEEDDEVEPLTGTEMANLIYTKYGKAYDVSFARRDVPGKAFVCLNIMWTHLEQRSFKMTEAQYLDKVDSVAYMVNVLGQTERVRSFLIAPARSDRGLPRRPVVGTAISIQLDLAPDVVQDFFGSGYY